MGFLTSFRSSRANSALQKFLRVIEFLSPVVSLGRFASRVAKIVRLGQQATTTSNKAVLGILGAAVLYTLIAMILQFTVKHGGPKILRWLMMLLDVLFIIAFYRCCCPDATWREFWILWTLPDIEAGACHPEESELQSAVRDLHLVNLEHISPPSQPPSMRSKIIAITID
ncbi:hypothetical protein B0A48_00039 [Cryoendolithus antarcticus]|uniref:Uncharacterized protein n=1 Tax=Cryoendolithus antarcticus TaxID=1507870 RepID=A0A1V8TTK2_9PEZI|nr:hypothetical protein B0A48_00039 [Cryoendolithus antarcticus]